MLARLRQLSGGRNQVCEEAGVGTLACGRPIALAGRSSRRNKGSGLCGG